MVSLEFFIDVILPAAL